MGFRWQVVYQAERGSGEGSWHKSSLRGLWEEQVIVWSITWNGRLEMILERQTVRGLVCHDKELGFILNFSVTKKLVWLIFICKTHPQVDWKVHAWMLEDQMGDNWRVWGPKEDSAGQKGEERTAWEIWGAEYCPGCLAGPRRQHICPQEAYDPVA